MSGASMLERQERAPAAGVLRAGQEKCTHLVLCMQVSHRHAEPLICRVQVSNVFVDSCRICIVIQEGLVVELQSFQECCGGICRQDGHRSKHRSMQLRTVTRARV